MTLVDACSTAEFRTRVDDARGERERRVGWWVVFEEANDGEIPDGFFVDDERAKTLGDEPGFVRHRLAPCWIRERT